MEKSNHEVHFIVKTLARFPRLNSSLCDKKTWIIKTIFPIILIAMLAKHVAEDAVEVLKVMFGSAWKSWRKWQAQGKWM